MTPLSTSDVVEYRPISQSMASPPTLDLQNDFVTQPLPITCMVLDNGQSCIASILSGFQLLMHPNLEDFALVLHNTYYACCSS